MDQQQGFHSELRNLADQFAHKAYRLTRTFPADEKFGITSQLRRAALSVPLNIIEGYGRGQKRVHANFIRIAYGSLKESEYLLMFTHDEKLVSDSDFKEIMPIASRIGGMLWGILENLDSEK